MEETSSPKGLQAEPGDMPALSYRTGKGEEAERVAIWSTGVCILVPGMVGAAWLEVPGPILIYNRSLIGQSWLDSLILLTFMLIGCKLRELIVRAPGQSQNSESRAAPVSLLPQG